MGWELGDMSSPNVTIIDYGVGNLLSVQRGFEYFGASVELTSDPEKILSAQRVVLPGVGAFPKAMQALKSQNLVTVIQELSNKGTPLLAICLGMQLLLEGSDEFGKTAGLGLISGRVVAVPKKTIDGTIRENTARYINHSCRPNCEVEIKKGKVLVFSKRNIEAGEELSYDYGKEFWNEHIKPIGCKCLKCLNK